MKKAGFLILISLLTCRVFGQDWKLLSDWKPISDGLKFYDFPFLGGINNPRFQFADVNLDGFDDLVILDNQSELIYLQTAGSETRKPADSRIFSDRVKTWFLLQDLSGDNKPDLISKTDDGKTIWWKHTGNSSLPFDQSEILTASDGSTILTDGLSQPCFSDFDRDGDFDFFAGLPEGSILFYENTGTIQIPSFTFRTSVFAGIHVLADTVFVDPSSSLKKSADPQHGASAVQLFDLNGDGLDDIFFGDFLSPSLYIFKNQGPAANPVFFYDPSPFPESEPVETPGYNQAFFRSMTDNFEFYVGVNLPTVNKDSFWKFTNAGTRTEPELILETKSFLSTLDAGRNSRPVMVNFTGGLNKDLVVGNQAGFLSYYKFTSDAYFSLQSEKWALTTPFFEASPAFADLNGDDKSDLIVGGLDGKLRSFTNSGTFENPVFQSENLWFSGINPGNRSKPFFADLNWNFTQDLICGNGNGDLILYENKGTLTQPSFDQKEVIQTGLTGTSPVFFYFPGLNKPAILSGSDDGTLALYKSDKVDYTNSEFPSQFYLAQTWNTGIPMLTPGSVSFISPDSLQLIAGCQRGGVLVLQAKLNSDRQLEPKFKIQVYPNPSKTIASLYSTLQLTQVRLFTLTGQLLKEWNQPIPFPLNFDLPELSTGLYLIEAKSGNKTAISKWIILK
ncbi:MAG: T9SS type A sorting domain-containing protein [Bacteroidetes bacterium]|nr:T9SS type A sorting domain-containing protein [Bacteroidota bacterium]